MMADRPLAAFQGGTEIAGTRLTLGDGGDETEQTKPDRVRQHFEVLRELT